MTLAAFVAPYTRDENPPEFSTKEFGPFAHGGLANGVVPLFVTDRACDLESITVRAGTVGTQGTIRFGYSPSGVVLDTTGSVYLSAAEATTQLTAATSFLVPVTNGNNIPAGATVYILAAGNIGGVAGLCITVRTQNRRYRQTNNGRKQFLDAPLS
jgi:hypothetical protein